MNICLVSFMHVCTKDRLDISTEMQLVASRDCWVLTCCSYFPYLQVGHRSLSGARMVHTLLFAHTQYCHGRCFARTQYGSLLCIRGTIDTHVRSRARLGAARVRLRTVSKVLCTHTRYNCHTHAQQSTDGV